MIELQHFSIGYKENSLLHEVNATIKKGQLTAYRKKRDRKIDVAPRHSRSEPVLFRKNHSRRARHRLHENRRYGKNAGCRHDRAHAHRQPAVQGCRSIGRAPYTNWIGRMQETDKEIVMQSLISVGMEAYANRTMDKMSDGECSV